MVVIRYVENVSEAAARIMRKHNVPVATKSYKSLKTVLVHPKDKHEKEDLTECVYKVPSIYLSKKSRLGRRKCRNTTRAPNNVN